MAKSKRARNLVHARMILWDRGAQQRFVEAVEKICNLAGEMALTLHHIQEERKAFQLEIASKRSEAARRANLTRKAMREPASNPPLTNGNETPSVKETSNDS